MVPIESFEVWADEHVNGSWSERCIQRVLTDQDEDARTKAVRMAAFYNDAAAESAAKAGLDVCQKFFVVRVLTTRDRI